MTIGHDTASQSGFQMNMPSIVCLLYLTGFFGGITALAGVVIVHLQRSEAGGTWAASHYDYHVRTFWLGLLILLTAAPLTLVTVGWVIVLWWVSWTTARTVRALLAAQKQQPIANPATLLW